MVVSFNKTEVTTNIAGNGTAGASKTKAECILCADAAQQSVRQEGQETHDQKSTEAIWKAKARIWWLFLTGTSKQRACLGGMQTNLSLCMTDKRLLGRTGFMA
jgi:hypothetical protein